MISGVRPKDFADKDILVKLWELSRMSHEEELAFNLQAAISKEPKSKVYDKNKTYTLDDLRA